MIIYHNYWQNISKVNYKISQISSTDRVLSAVLFSGEDRITCINPRSVISDLLFGDVN